MMIGPSVGKNLLELADELKNLSEQEIVMEIQNPQKYPQYLVFTELDRRNKMKAKYAQDQQGPPETTMIEERMMGIQTPPGGIGGAPQGPPQGPQGPPPGPPGPPPQAGSPPGAPGTPNMQAMMMAQGGAPGGVRGFKGGGLLTGASGPILKAIQKGPLSGGALGLAGSLFEKEKKKKEEEEALAGMAHGGVVRGYHEGGMVEDDEGYTQEVLEDIARAGAKMQFRSARSLREDPPELGVLGMAGMGAGSLMTLADRDKARQQHYEMRDIPSVDGVRLGEVQGPQDFPDYLEDDEDWRDLISVGGKLAHDPGPLSPSGDPVLMGYAGGGIVQPRNPRRGFFAGGRVLSYDEWIKGPGAAYAPKEGESANFAHSMYRQYQSKANQPASRPNVVSEATSAVRPDPIRDVSFTESVVEEAAPFSGSTRITSGGGPGSGSGIQPVNDPLESLLGSEVEEVEEGGGFMDTVGDYGSQAWDWAEENPLDAAAMGLMFLPGVGWVAGTGIKAALGGARLAKAGYQAYKAADLTNKARRAAGKPVVEAMKKLQGPAGRRGLPPGEAPPSILGKGAGGRPQANESWWRNTLRQPGRQERHWLTGKKTGNIRTDKQLAEHYGKLPVRAAKLGAAGGAALGARELMERLPEGPDLDLNLSRDLNPSQEQLARMEELGMLSAYEPTNEYDNTTIIEGGLTAGNGGGLPGASTPQTYEEWLDSTGGVAGAESMDSWDKGLALAQISSALLGAKKGRLGEALGEGIKQATPVMMAGRKGERDRRQQEITNRLAYQGLADKQPYYDSLSAFNDARAKDYRREGRRVDADVDRDRFDADVALGSALEQRVMNRLMYGNPQGPSVPGQKPREEFLALQESGKLQEKFNEEMEKELEAFHGRLRVGREARLVAGLKAGGLVGSSGGTVAEKMNFR